MPAITTWEDAEAAAMSVGAAAHRPAAAALVASFLPMTGPQQGARQLTTAFEPCGLSFRKTPRMNGLPCRKDEEESCNEVHATCARVLKLGYQKDMSMQSLGRYNKPGPPCKPQIPIPGVGSMPKDSIFGGLMNMAAGEDLPPTFMPGCNSRLNDFPWGLDNPYAKSAAGGSIMKWFYSKPTNQVPSLTVWGLAVHGKSGTPFFDSHGSHATDYIYEIRQGSGAPPDFYVCDSRTHPQACALIGGNLRAACAEWYDPRMCQMCEDHGHTIVCSVRGWSQKYFMWSKVPIYPRDLLGELYRGEWSDVYARPMWASIEIPKADLRHDVKEMPEYMVADGEARKAIAEIRGPMSPPTVLNPFAAWAPVVLVAPEPLGPNASATWPATPPASRPPPPPQPPGAPPRQRPWPRSRGCTRGCDFL